MSPLALGWLFHPLHGAGYQFWSGIGSDVTELAVVFAVWSWLTSRNCHVRRCWRAAWHPDPVHGHPVCKRHHPHTGKVVRSESGGTVVIEDEGSPI